VMLTADRLMPNASAAAGRVGVPMATGRYFMNAGAPGRAGND